MPELPEVETIKNTIQPILLGAKIKNIEIRQRKFREIIPDDFEEKFIGAVVISIKRIAKYMIINFDNQFSIIWHFGMSGKIRIESSIDNTKNKHDHVVFETDKGIFVYNDVRRFGLITLCESDKLKSHHLLKNIGMDPWDEKLTEEYLLQKLNGKKTPIKIELLNQEIICGIGNIYASEILYKARIHPEKISASITKNEALLIIKYTREILESAIRAGGSTIHDYKKPDGNIGYFQQMHCVYNKTGQKCPDCKCNIEKTGGIKKIVQGGRSSFYCETLQKKESE